MADGDGLAWDSPEVATFIASLPRHVKLVPITELGNDARATLRQAMLDGGLDGKDVDKPASSEESLVDMRRILDELSFLPPLCKPEQVGALRAALRSAAGQGYLTMGHDDSGLVTSPSEARVRAIMNGDEQELAILREVFRTLTAITRTPEGSEAPGTPEGPPRRITIRDLKAATPSTLGEPKHVDVKPREPLGPASVEGGLVRRPRLIWTFDARNPLRVCCWRARACLEVEPPTVGGGIVASERVRCDAPYLHEGMTTVLSGEAIGKRLQIVTDPDWFNPEAARALMVMQAAAAAEAAPAAAPSPQGSLAKRVVSRAWRGAR